MTEHKVQELENIYGKIEIADKAGPFYRQMKDSIQIAADIMSLSSLVFQFGALMSSVLCSAAIQKISISMLRRLCGICYIGVAVVTLIVENNN